MKLYLLIIKSQFGLLQAKSNDKNHETKKDVEFKVEMRNGLEDLKQKVKGLK
jgi:hypothetical protein